MKTKIYLQALIFSIFLSGVIQAQKVEPFQDDNFMWGIKDAQGKIIAKPIYESYSNLENFGLIMLKLNTKWGVIDYEGNEVFPFEYDQFAETLYPDLNGDWVMQMSKNEKKGFLNLSKKMVFIDCKYDDASEMFEKGIAAVKLEEKWGFIDVKEETVIPFIYEDVLTYFGVSFLFTGDLLLVKKNGKWGGIDEKGNVLIEFKFDEILTFYEGKAEATLNGRTFFIDKNGKEIKN